jgi:hypothetical protein
VYVIYVISWCMITLDYSSLASKWAQSNKDLPNSY